jgi:hypothetical protein
VIMCVQGDCRIADVVGDLIQMTGKIPHKRLYR